MKIKFFQNIDFENEFQKKGFLKIGTLSPDALKKLIHWNNELKIPDAFGFGYNVGMNTPHLELRKKMREIIIDTVYPEVANLLNERIPYSASFMNKNSNPFAFVAAHQDWTFTDEEIIDSVMCWIPLVDVSIENAALGFIPYSNNFYNYVRAFPFNVLQTPVFINQLQLMSYLEIIDMKAGEIIFFNQKTIHGSFANYSLNERTALSLSWVHKKHDILTYVCNPKNKGKTLLKYKVPIDFMVSTNYPIIADMYTKGELKLDYKAIDEIEVSLPSSKWEDMKRLLDEHQIIPNEKHTELTNQLITLKQGKLTGESLLDKIKKIFK